MIFSRRDSIALPVAAIVGVVFAYLTIQAGFVGVFIFVFYSLIIIPLIVHFLAQGKLLVWQVCTLSFVAYIIAKNASLGGFAIGDALQEFHVIWGLETVLSLPLPAYYYFHRAKQRKSYRVEIVFCRPAVLQTVEQPRKEPIPISVSRNRSCLGDCLVGEGCLGLAFP